MSGRQLFLIDQFRDTGRPLLSILADPASIFMKALARFQNRSLYANIINDRSATYYTTSIASSDPFVDLDAINIRYLQGTENVLLDPEHPATPRGPAELSPISKRILNGTKNQITQLPLMALLALIIPLGTVVFLFNAAVQSVRSRQRIRLHEEGKAGIDVGGYRIPLHLMLNKVQGIYERTNQDHEQEYLPVSDTDSALSKSHQKSSHSFAIEPDVKQGSPSGFPTLALTPAQFAMIQALDDVGFKKYLVHIHKARHSHAAIIVRFERKNFSEGRIVLKHWANEFKL